MNAKGEISHSPFDVSFHFDHNLRDVPNAPAQMQQAVEWLQSQLKDNTNNTRKQIELLGLIGVYARMLHDFPTAQQALISAIELSDSIGSDRYKTINLIRLAHLYQWQQQYILSENLFEQVLINCRNNSELNIYLDFAYQHLGKCKFEQARYVEAKYYFEEALKIRKTKGDHSLIQSTKLALDVVQQYI
ncbi:hypothetical protein CEN46_24470 [Fischerella thermalis CCMEE 5318]|uniref:Uncharacterized protein n=1 Tax=Fischerella thermalis CCMEE 5318 TaxID=2019666 RepID=A0A2N6L5P2_9CYAN|nr:hypothetical protein CEN46_24470 [Fischerella thermalis CCMEE 5318]